MKHYKNIDNSIWAFEPDGSQDHLITADMTAISDEELAVLRAPDPKLVILGKVSALEALITPRRIRDALLGNNTFIRSIEAQIAELRAQVS